MNLKRQDTVTEGLGESNSFSFRFEKSVIVPGFPKLSLLLKNMVQRVIGIPQDVLG